MIPESNSVPSPCVRSCCLDENDICLGCFRSLEEILNWAAVDDAGKRAILANAHNRKASQPDLGWDPQSLERTVASGDSKNVR